MKRNRPSKSDFISPRNLAAVLLFTFGILLTSLAATQSHQTTRLQSATPAATGASPGSGTLSVSNPALSYADPVGPAPNATGEGVTGAPTCAMNGVDCSNYVLTLDPSIFASTAGYDPTIAYIVIQLSWTPAAYSYGSFIEDKNGNVIASNTSGVDPESIYIPVGTANLQANGPYTIVTTLEIGTPGTGYSGSVTLKQIPPVLNTCSSCQPPRYQMYVGPDNQSGEPSIGVDWNPNVASLQQTASGTAANGPTALNTGGVAFYTADFAQYRVSFDDCSSPAINTWTDTTFPTEGITTLDPIGFTDHFSSLALGTSYPPPKTPGRTFQAQLTAGDSRIAYTDDDGNTHIPSQGGGVPQGPDHETVGGGPYNPNSTPPPPSNPTYPNAIYYCTQNIAPEAECSRSDDGGLTFGPGVPIYQNPVNNCSGSIHGHVKVATDGTVYVPNYSCALPSGQQGVAVSTDNGLTWTERNVPGSGPPEGGSGGLVDPSVGIAQNAVGRPSGQTTSTIYFGFIDGDKKAKVSVSHDRGVTWSAPQDAGAPFNVLNTTFPAVVVGDDNRAAFGFLGSTTGGDGTSSNASCSTFQGIWHLYIATTYDGGNTWTTIDATPNSPIQVGPICNGGTLCPGFRNLLDFNGFDVDSQGRGYFVVSDGCINCTNSGPGAPCGSSNALSVMFRQSGGPRLFSQFDSMPQAAGVWAPATPQAVAAIRQQSGGVEVSWLEPDNGGSPITSYNIYRGTASGTETLLASVSNSATQTNTKYLDTTATGNSGYFYHVTAVNAQGESGFCQELTVSNQQSSGTTCTAPYVEVDGPGSGSDPTSGELTIQSVNVGEPFASCSDQSITSTMKCQTFDPTGTGNAVLPANAEWRILFKITDDAGNPETVFLDMNTQDPATTPTSPDFVLGREDPCTTGCSTLDSAACTQGPASSCPTITGSFTPQGLITFKLTDTTLSFPAPGAPGTGKAFTWTPKKGDVLTSMNGTTLLLVGGGGTGFLETVQSAGPAQGGSGSYTMQGNLSCAMAPPTAALSASPLSGNVPLTVSFDGSKSTVAPILASCDAIASYTMNFGDGSAPVTQTTPSFSHIYSAAGSFPATLTVTDTIGQKSDNLAQEVITVKSSSGKPEVAITASPTQIHEGGTATFTVFVSPVQSKNLLVSFGQGGTAKTNDYTLSGVTKGVVTIPAGQPSASFTLTAVNDKGETEAKENTDTAIITLKAGTGYTVISPSSATVTILP